MKGVYLIINNLGIHSRLRDITSYTFENILRDAPAHYKVVARYNYNTNKTYEFDNHTCSFVIEF